jgi:hypothetical protein
MSEPITDFIGRDEELRWLKGAWAQARKGQPKLRVLRGESGFGKTRIVQAFYSWLSTDPEQDPQGYWPDALLKEGNNLRLNPPASEFGEAGSLPWLWWGVRWGNPDDHNRGELSACAVIDGLTYLEPHREALLARQHKLKRGTKAAAELGAVVGELASFGLLGAGKSLVELVQQWREERQAHAHEQLSVDERQAAALQTQMDDLYEFLHGLLVPPAVSNATGLPLVLVLDDAHWIDPRSLAFVERLLTGANRHGWPLLVIATHWEQDWNLQAQDAQAHNFPALYARLAADPAQNEHALSLDIREIDRLDGLERLLLSSLPGLTAEQMAFLCERADGNPRLMNEIILELSNKPYYFEQEDLTRALSADGLTILEKKSFKLHDLQVSRFQRLDEGLRRLLGYASYQGMRFLRELVLDAARVLDAQQAPEDNADRLASAVQPYAVLAAESAVIYEFRHRVFHDLARERIDKLPRLGPLLRDALLNVAEDWLAQGRLVALAAAEREAFYLLMLDQLEQV